MAKRYGSKKTGIYSTKKDIIRAYDTGYIKRSIKRTNVDYNRPKKWTTLYTDVKTTNTVMEEQDDISTFTERIREYRKQIVPYDYDTRNSLRQQIKLKTASIHELMLKQHANGNLPYGNAREILSKYRKALRRQQGLKQPDTTKIAKYSERIAKLEKYIADNPPYSVQIKQLKHERAQLRRKYSIYTQSDTAEQRIDYYNKRIAELKAKMDTNPQNFISSPYLPNEIEIIKQEYQRLNLRFFASKEDMYTYFKKGNANYWETHNFNDYWRQYKHRDELIASGQYEELLAYNYRENYIKSLKSLGINNPLVSNIIANLNKLNVAQLMDLFKKPSTKVTDPSRTAMPVISFVYETAGVLRRGNSEEQNELVRSIKQAFMDVGLDYDTTIGTESTAYEEIAKKKYSKYIARQIAPEQLPDILETMDILRTDVAETLGEGSIARFNKTALFTYARLLNYAERAKYSPQQVDTYAKRQIILEGMRKMIRKTGLRMNKRGEYYVPFYSKELVNELLNDLK